MKANRIFSAAIEAGLFTAFMVVLFVVAILAGIASNVLAAAGFVALQSRRLRPSRDAIVFCVALACAWAAAQIDDPAPAVAPAVAIATASR